MKILSQILSVLCFALFVSACVTHQASSRADLGDHSKNINLNIEKQNSNTVYNLDEFKKFKLSKKLMEISGLTMDAFGKNLYAVNDEKARLFKLSLDGKILSQIDFGKSADYEGLEKVGDSIFILKSNGKIIEFDLLEVETVESHNNPLSQTNDTEGLAYDAFTHSLLIACKGSPNIEGKSKSEKSKAVYAFDISSKELLEEPLLRITDEQITEFVKTKWKSELSKKKYETKLQRAKHFSPSAIAVHPVDGNFYLLSSVGKTLMVSDRKSEIKSLYFLDDDAYIQPEGICFDGLGNIWISNEGNEAKDLRSNILRISSLN